MCYYVMTELTNYAASDGKNCLNTLPSQDLKAGLPQVLMLTGHSDSLLHTHRMPEESGPLRGTVEVGSQCSKDF